MHLENTASKAVRSVAIVTEGSKLSTMPVCAYERFMEPGTLTYRGIVLAQGWMPPDGSIKLSVDFVEFADGSSWGEDSKGKSKYLAGTREGARYAIKLFREA